MNGGISIHAPREGGDKSFREGDMMTEISIHAPREGGDYKFPPKSCIFIDISIHAPREGGDAVIGYVGDICTISIHAPREGGDGYTWYNWDILYGFQSTPPARGATGRSRTYYGLS